MLRDCSTPSWSAGSDPWQHKRRIKIEEKARVVASFSGEEFIQFLATLVVLRWTILNYRMKEKDEFILLFKIVLGKIASAARN